MPAKQIYATANDWRACLHDIELDRPLAYTLTGLFEDNRVATYVGVDAIPNFGIVPEGNSVSLPAYLVHDNSHEIVIEPIPQRRGGTKFAIDGGCNPSAIHLKPGGMYRTEMLIAGHLGTATENRAGIELYDLVVRRIQQSFSRIKAYLVGPEAASLLDSGMRLTVSCTPNTMLDLIRG